MQTATAYHPSSLFPEPPPRNIGVPETSIAGGATEAKSFTAHKASLPDRSQTAQHDHSQKSMSEGEAQATPQRAPASKPLRPRRYNFGARKATIKLSPSAVAHLRELLELPEPKLIRIGTKAKGCSGLAYHLEYVDKPSTLDEQVEQDGVKVLIDNKALLNIIGSEMDWLEDKLNQRFIFKNPNISTYTRSECINPRLTKNSGAMWMWRILQRVVIPLSLLVLHSMLRRIRVWRFTSINCHQILYSIVRQQL